MTADPAFSKKKIEMIPAKNLSVVWVQAQRPFKAKKAKDIADNFDEEMFGTLSVTKPNGQGIYHIIEGQHRRAAVEIKFGPDEPVPCEVLDAVDCPRAAELFDGINNRRNAVNAIATFKVRLTAQYMTEIDVDKIVRAAGFKIEYSRAEKNLTCVDALKSVYTRCGPKILKDTIDLIKSSWGTDPNAYSSAMVRGYAAFLLLHGGKANWQRTKDVMIKKYTPGRLMGAAKTHRESQGGSLAEAITALLIINYNRGSKRPLV
jgi:hypothetical protein